MARQKKKAENEVIKASASIQIEGRATLLQRRAWNVLLANAYDELPHNERHTIPVQVLMRTLEYNSTNQDYLKEALEALVGCVVKWNILDKDGETEWGVAALLAGAKISHGICTYEYGSILREKLHNPRMYARLSLSVQNRFDSKHALSLWELCIDYLGAQRDYGETPWIALEDFRKLMGTEGMYPAFMNFNQKVITPAIAEINRVSDFRVSVDYQRQGRKVTALKFKIRRVVLLPERSTGQGKLFPALEDMPLVVKEMRDTGMSSQDAWDIWQQGFQFVDAAARPADPRADADTAFVQYVREKIHLLKRRQASGRVENSTGFLREAIRRNYANPEFEQEQKHQAVVDAQKASKEREKQVKRLAAQKAEIEKVRDRELQELCKQIAVESPDILETALPEIRAENYVFRQFYKPDQSALENYQASPMLQMGFTPYLERHAPERFEAVKQHYAAQLAAVEAQLAALP